MNDLKKSLNELIDDTRLPGPPSIEELRRRTGGRVHRNEHALTTVEAPGGDAPAPRTRRLVAGALATVVVITGGALAVAYGPRSSDNGPGTRAPALGGSLSSSGATAYLTSGPSIIPVDLATGTATSPISLPGRVTEAVAITPDGRTAYVTTYESSSPYAAAVVPIDVASGTVDSPISVPIGIAGIAITPDGRTAYVTTGAPGEIIPIDLADESIGSPISVPGIRPGIAITPDGLTALTTVGPNTVVPVDLATRTVGTPISLPVGASAVAVAPDGSTAYAIGPTSTGSAVVPIDLARNAAGPPIPVPAGADGIAVTPDGHTAYVTTTSVPGEMVPIDLANRTVGGPVAVPANSGGLAIAPAVHHVQGVLFTHTSPDGSSVTARTVTCATPIQGPFSCGTGTAGAAATEFDYSVDHHRYSTVVLASDPRLTESPQAGMIPLFGSALGSPPPAADLIILSVRAPAVVVRLAPSGPGGAAPKGDAMTAVDGWVVFPIHNFNNLARPEAFDDVGKSLGQTVPFPCC
ncbi:MAG TPA: YncE family protein [Acidimicrobiales bacterium]